MTGWDAGSAGINPERVAELLVDLGGARPGRRGSGYRVSASAVLTTAHVVRDAAQVRVRFNADRPGEWLTDGTVAWSDPTVDAAVVTISPRPQDEDRVAPVGFGRVAERDAVLTCSAMGFPRFKLRNDPDQPLDDGSPSQYRDSAHAVGTIAVLANRREGTLEVTVARPERDPHPERSPWEGMSGAAVWSGGRIIGLVAEHHRADGLGRLTATRVDRWYERLAAEQLGQLRTLVPVLPANASSMVDVVPRTPGELLEAGYTAQVRDIAPEQLVGREEELAELVQFCAGDQRYAWWQADPWAGKSALAAWFVLHPPTGVRIVSFFVTGRLAGQADSDAFTEAMVEQLAALVGEGAPRSSTAGGWDRERRRLLDLAAASIGDRGERLLVVVDGLDEDEGAKLDSGKPSIASLLPKRLPDTVRVLVLSRSSPGIPGDVPSDHPLRHCAVRKLDPWSEAHDVRLRAKHELLQQLHGDQLQVDIISFISAAGGGLTLTELAELTGRPRYLLDGRLGSAFGRSLMTRVPTDRPPDDERVYLFAHETLRTIAEEELAGDLGPYRQRIAAWADGYRAQGWPAGTPRYLLRPYGRLLATSGDLPRLMVLATDPGRHDRMLAYTQGDAAALAEIATTQQLVLSEPIPDLGAMGRLAVCRDRLANRNRGIPVGLPALWARLGEHRRGVALARGTDASTQAEAMAAIAVALAEVDRDRALSLAADAEQLARTITGPIDRARVLTAVAGALTELGQWDHAEQLARTITRPEHRTEAMAALAKAMAAVDRDRALSLAADAEQAARTIDAQYQAMSLATVARATAEVGGWDHAEHLARSIDYHHGRVLALTLVAGAMAEAGQRERALALAADAEQAARDISSPDFQADALTMVAEVLVELGRWDNAEQLARNTDAPAQARVFTALALALAEVDPARAVSLLVDAEQAAQAILDHSGRAWSLTTVAKALAEIGRSDHAERLARTLDSPYDQAEALTAVAKALIETGHLDHAEQVARSTDAAVQARVLTAVAEALAAVDRDRALILAADAEQAARTTNPHDQAVALAAVARAAAEIDRARALTLATDAEQLARGIDSPYDQAEALTAVAKALIEVGHWDHAERLARGIDNRHDQVRALAAVAQALAAVGQWGRAERIADSIDGHYDQVRALAAVAKALAAVGQGDDAERIARRIPHPTAQAEALATVARATAADDRARALTLASDAERLARGIDNPRGQAEALATVAQALAELGQWGRAEQVGRGIAGAEQARALTAVAVALADVDRDRALALAADAEQAARGIADPAAQAEALTTVAGALAAVDRRDRALILAADAERAARGILDPAAQVRAYRVIAASVPAAYSADRARSSEVLRVRAWQLMAHILGGAYWLEATQPLGKLDPSGVMAIAEALQALNPGMR